MDISTLDVGPLVMFLSFLSKLVFFLIQFICVFFVMGELKHLPPLVFQLRCIALNDPRQKNLVFARTNTYIGMMIKTNVGWLWYFKPIQRI